MASTLRSIQHSSDGTMSQNRIQQNVHDRSPGGSISFNDRPAVSIPGHFSLGEFIKSESRHTEFKDRLDMVKGAKIDDVVDIYIVGFLNSEGGTLYLGVGDKECSVVGIYMTDVEKREFENNIARLAEKTAPPCTGKYTMHFVEVRLTHSTSKKSYVIMIDVPQQKDKKEIYRNSNKEIIVRSNVINVSLATNEDYEFEKKVLEDELKKERQLLQEKRGELQELEATYKKTKHEVDVLEKNGTREIEEKETKIKEMKEELDELRNEVAKQQELNKSKRQEREENIARFHEVLDEVRNKALEELQKKYNEAKEAIQKWDKEPGTSAGVHTCIL